MGPTVEVKDCDEHQIEVDGKKYITYPVWALWMTIVDLQFFEAWSPENGHQLRFRGNANLDRGGLLAVIGRNDANASKLPVTIRPRSLTQNEGVLSSRLEPGHCLVGWYFDKEERDRGGWFLECYVEEESFTALLEAYRSRRWTGLRLSVKCDFWFNEVAQYAPDGRGLRYFLRPSERNGEIDFPKVAKGSVELLTWQELDEENAKSDSVPVDHDSNQARQPTALEIQWQATLREVTRVARNVSIALIAIAGSLVVIAFASVF